MPRNWRRAPGAEPPEFLPLLDQDDQDAGARLDTLPEAIRLDDAPPGGLVADQRAGLVGRHLGVHAGAAEPADRGSHTGYVRLELAEAEHPLEVWLRPELVEVHYDGKPVGTYHRDGLARWLREPHGRIAVDGMAFVAGGRLGGSGVVVTIGTDWSHELPPPRLRYLQTLV